MDKFREMVIIAGWPYSMTKSDYHIVGYIPIPMINTTSNKQKKLYVYYTICYVYKYIYM